MKDVLVSIIIPVYNVEKYINRCIDSVLQQSYKNIEVILVDDCSPDNCGKICDEYAEKDNRIKVIHKKNEGVSVARNVGIEIAIGEFIVFVDSDDYIVQDSIELLLLAQQKGDYDLVIGSYKCSEQNTYIPLGLDCDFTDREISENIVDIIEKTAVFTPWGKLYKVSHIKKNKISFRPGITFGEDVIFVMEYIKKVNSISCITKIVYNYNTSNEKNASCKYHDKFHEYSKVFTDLVKQIARKESEEIKKFINKRVSYVINHHIYNSYSLKSAVIGVHSTIKIYYDDIETGSFEACGRKAKFLVKYNIAWALVFYLKATRLILSLIRKIKKVIR